MYIYVAARAIPSPTSSSGPGYPSLHTQIRWTMNSKSITCMKGIRLKETGLGLPRGVLKNVLYGEAPLQGPSLLPTIFDVTEVAWITCFVAWKTPMIELLEAVLPEDPEPLSPLSSRVNHFLIFVNRTAYFPRKVSYFREDYRTVE